MNEMRWIVATSLRFRYLVVFVASGAYDLWHRPDSGHAGGRLSRVRAAAGGDSDPMPRAFLRRSGSLGHRSVGGGVQRGMPGLDVMRSKSVEQLSSIVLIFEPGTDMMEARQLVAERLAIVTPTLPTWAAPPFMLPPLSSTARTMKIGISSKERSVIDLSMITYWKIRERLLRVPGVANVAIWGEQIEMPQVRVDPERLAAHGVTLDEVLQATSDTLDSGMMQYSDGSTIGTGGFLETPNQRLAIRHVQPIVTPDDLANVPINDKTKSDGTPLRLGDVADMVDGTWPMIGDAVINDGPGLLLIVEKFPWANSLEVTQGRGSGDRRDAARSARCRY